MSGIKPHLTPLIVLELALSFSINATALAGGIVVKHVDLNEINKYKDSLSPDDYDNLMQRARDVETMIKSGPPKTLDNSEYNSAIQSISIDAQQKAEQRKQELESSEQLITDEFKRLDHSFEAYGRDLTDEQRRDIDQKAMELQSRWNDPKWDNIKVNDGLKECAQVLEGLRKVNSLLVEYSGSRSALSKDELPQGMPVMPRPIQPRSPQNESDLGNNPFTPNEFIDPKTGLPVYMSYRYTPFMHSSSRPQPLGKQLVDIQKQLVGFKNLACIGTLEYELLQKDLTDLTALVNQVKAQDLVDDGKNRNVHDLQSKIKELRNSINDAVKK